MFLTVHKVSHFTMSVYKPKQIHINKKLSCRRKTARCFVSLNILLTHSRSLKSFEMTFCRTASVLILHR